MLIVEIITSIDKAQSSYSWRQHAMHVTLVVQSYIWQDWDNSDHADMGPFSSVEQKLAGLRQHWSRLHGPFLFCWTKAGRIETTVITPIEQKLRAEKINTRWVGRPIGKASPSGGISYEDNLIYLQAIVKWKHYEYSLQAIVYSKCLVVFIEPKEVWSS